jgi:hypothetical protein
MNEDAKLTPESLFAEFRRERPSFGDAALRKFERLNKKKQRSFINYTMEFLNTETEDSFRSWGTSVLGIIGGSKIFKYLVDLLQKAGEGPKRKYPLTRFYALRALARLATSRNRDEKFFEVTKNISRDKLEKPLVLETSKILLSTRPGMGEFKKELRNTLQEYKDHKYYRPISRILYALREFPRVDLTDEVLAIMRGSEYYEHKRNAVITLRAPAYESNLKVIRALGEIVVGKESRGLRLEAVISLGALKNEKAEPDLIQALKDNDAEIRKQASRALEAILRKEGALSVVIQQALREKDEENRGRFIEAIRRIDLGRRFSVDLLSKELGGEDRERSQAAETILIELGGWAAVQRLSQLRNTLNHLDELLTKSEDIIKSTFKDTIRQARLNFYFAMVVNVLVVGVGVALIVLAIMHLKSNPDEIEGWVIPGAAGVIGIILNLGFNNPRRNARQDLATLMNVNIIFLGYLRQLNEIDATFKYAFMEDEEFGTDHMHRTVEQIERTMFQTLEMAARNLYVPTMPADEIKNYVEEDQGGRLGKDSPPPAA